MNKLGTRTTLIVTVFATALRLLLYNVVENPYFVLPIELLQGVGWSLFWAASVELVNGLVREELRATGQSLLTAAMLGAGAIAGNTWASYLSGKQIPVSQIFFLNAGIVVVIGIFMLIVLKFRPSAGSDTSQQI
jgi:MFS transporter, PPP family, 3-phenylpropionic acid transporter